MCTAECVGVLGTGMWTLWLWLSLVENFRFPKPSPQLASLESLAVLCRYMPLQRSDGLPLPLPILRVFRVPSSFCDIEIQVPKLVRTLGTCACAQVYVAPEQWSFPLRLPLPFFGIFGATSIQAGETYPWSDDFDHRVLTVNISKGAFYVPLS